MFCFSYMLDVFYQCDIVLTKPSDIIISRATARTVRTLERFEMNPLAINAQGFQSGFEIG